MPISPAELRSSITAALANKVLSATEAQGIIEKVRDSGGLDAAGATALVESLATALRSDGLDLTTAARQRNLNHLLAALDRQVTLPLDRGPSRPGTTTNYVQLLRHTATKPTVVPLGAYGGGKVAVTPEGGLQLDGADVDLNMVPPSDALISALWALNRPHHLEGLPAEKRAALYANLVAQLGPALEVNPEDPHKFNRYVATTAAIGALAQGGAAWDAATVDEMLGLVEKCPTPLMQALILRGAENDYITNWPDAKFLDFNELERIAKYAVRGETLPPMKVNGEVVQLGAFYDTVATSVRDAVDPARLRHAWMADRWGFRAKQAVQVLDVVAEQSVRNEGPVALLRQRFPDAEITVQVCGRAGDLSDQTWDDPYIPLWDGAYDTDERRIEMYSRTARYDENMVN